MNNPTYKISLKSAALCLFLGLSSCSQPNRTLNSFNPQASVANQISAQSRPADSTDISRFAFPLKSGQILEYSGTGSRSGLKATLKILKVTQTEVTSSISLVGGAVNNPGENPQVNKNDSHLLESWIDELHSQFGIANFITSFPRFFRTCAGTSCTSQINSPFGSIPATKVRHTNIVAETSNQALLNRSHIINPDDGSSLIPVAPPSNTFLIDIEKPFSLDLNFSQNLGLISVNVPQLNAGYTLTSFK